MCAKPACTEVVQVWLDFAPVSQQVFERSNRSDVSVGLCKLHASRFTVPDGWSFERLVHEPATEAEVTETRPAPDIVSTVNAEPTTIPKNPKNRKNTRERPWFLALRDGDDGMVDAAEPDRDRRAPKANRGEPTVGSLLHRAFHGPDRDVDTERAARDQQDELESRRVARDTDGYSTAELPFPPFEPEHQAAVS